MNEPQSPFDPSLVVTYLWVWATALLGGLASFFGKVKGGAARPWNITEFIGEMLVSALAGMITFWLAHAAGINQWVEAAMVAISGHMGARALFLFERWAERKWPVFSGGDDAAQTRR